MRQQFEQPVAMREKARILARRELVARPRQVDIDLSTMLAGDAAEHDDAIAEIDRLFEIVGDEDDGDLLFGRELQDLVLQALPRHGVERAERLVHQQELGLLRQAARDLHALLHAAGKLAGELILGVAEPHLGQQLVDRPRPAAPVGMPRASRLSATLPRTVRQGSSAFE